MIITKPRYKRPIKSTRQWQEESNAKAIALWNANKQLVENYGEADKVTGRYNKFDGNAKKRFLKNFITYNILECKEYIIEFKDRTFSYFDIYNGKKAVSKSIRDGVFIECGLYKGKVLHNQKYENLMALGKLLNKEVLYATITNDNVIIVHNLSKLKTDELKYQLRWVLDNFNEVERHKRRWGNAFVKFSESAYYNKNKVVDYKRGDKLPAIMSELLKPMYLLLEEQGETYFKHV
jgi:hypothetical protein